VAFTRSFWLHSTGLCRHTRKWSRVCRAPHSHLSHLPKPQRTMSSDCPPYNDQFPTSDDSRPSIHRSHSDPEVRVFPPHLTSPTSLSQCSLHLDILSWSGLHTSVVLARRKLFRDFSRAAEPWWLNIGCRGSFVCLVLF